MKIELISNFNIEPLKRALLVYEDFKNDQIVCSKYGQIYQTLIDINEKKDLIVIWFTPENVIKSFNDSIYRKSFAIERLLEETNIFVDLVAETASKANTLLVVSMFNFQNYKTYGLLDYNKGIGPSRILLDINQKLAEKFDDIENAYLLDSSTWYSNTKRILNNKMNYIAKVPFSIEIFQNSAEAIKNAITTISGRSKKLVIIDLDNTIWGGVVGENGIDGIELGGHSFIGEAYKDFQKELLSLTHIGIQLAIVSKNDETTAIEAIQKHPEMVFKIENIVSWRINWDDKVKNILEIAKEVNVGLDSIVFFDDNPIERARVRGALPEIFVPELPNDPTQFSLLLRKLNCFDIYSLTTEDQGRTTSYIENIKRKNESYQYESIQDWIDKLETELIVEELNRNNIKRCTQLLNKTNQFNLSTRRLTQSELETWLKGKNNTGITISVKDKFGYLGIVGFIGLKIEGKKIIVTDFILSCRAMGRNIENSMLYIICKFSKTIPNIEYIESKYIKTNRNQPIATFLANSSFKTEDNITYLIYHPFKVDKPKSIKITRKNN